MHLYSNMQVISVNFYGDLANKKNVGLGSIVMHAICLSTDPYTPSALAISDSGYTVL